MDGGRVRSSAYLVTQAKFATQDALNAIDQEEEILPLGDPLHFQVSSACGNGAQRARLHLRLQGFPRLGSICSHLGGIDGALSQSIEC